VTADLPSRISAAIGHGLWYAQSDPDSVQSEATKAVLAVVQPIAVDRDRLVGELEDAAHRTNVQRTRAEQAEAERDQYAVGIPLICADDRHEAKVRGLEAERDRLTALADARHRVIERMARDAFPTEGVVERVREWLNEWGQRLPDGACHTLDQALNHRPARRRSEPTPTVTNHTYEGEPGHGQPCQAEAFGDTCGAAWEQHEIRPAVAAKCSQDEGFCDVHGYHRHAPAWTTPDNPLTSTNTVDNPKEQS